MYSLILGGGLGNQMFQYAYVRSLQLKYNIQFVYNTYNYDINNTEVETRKFSLEHFCIKEPYIIQDKVEAIKANILYHRCMKKYFIIRKILPVKVSTKLLATSGCICSIKDPYSYNEIEISCSDGVIHGGFQSEKYFSEYADIIKKELTVKIPCSENNLKIIDMASNCSSVAIHIRRGDYLNPRYLHLNVCNEDYYSRAVECINEKVENPRFFVFSNSSDDIQWIKENYLFLPQDTIYVDNSNQDFQDLQLMYSCKHFVISNSTYSWWGQYLGSSPNKIVIAPSVWNKNELIASREIYQDSWHLIDVN